MIKKPILFLLLIIAFSCHATDLKPWFGKEYEAEIRASVLYQNYHSLASPDRHAGTENDAFTSLSIAYPFKRYCCEFEATVANTRYQNCRWDNFRFTGRVQGLDERAGDCISLVGGITITQPMSRALHDVSSFHHGHLEAEFTLSVGKEYGIFDYPPFQYRWWNVFGIGQANLGVPWVRDYVAFEYRYNDVHQFRGFAEVLYGTGAENIGEFGRHCFDGYGYIKHRSVDVGIRYSLDLNCWGTLSLQYSRRVYASNFPDNANLVYFEYYVPFGSQFTCSY